MILEIALGIVLAVIILRFLPSILGCGLTIFALLVAAVLGVFLFSWLKSNLRDVIAFGFLVLIYIAASVAWQSRRQIVKWLAIKRLQISIHVRQLFGYEKSIEEQELARLTAESHAGSGLDNV